MIMPPMCAALLIPLIMKPIAKLIPKTIINVFLSKINSWFLSCGKIDSMVRAAPKPMTAPDAPAPTPGYKSCLGSPSLISS